jgi:hypothetical protein
MKITLTTSQGKTLIKEGTPDQADAALRSIYKRDKHSDIYYSMEIGSETVTGSIDMEPKSFHAPHNRKIFTNHVRTYFGNVARATVEKYPYLNQEYINKAKQIYKLI